MSNIENMPWDPFPSDSDFEIDADAEWAQLEIDRHNKKYASDLDILLQANPMNGIILQMIKHKREGKTYREIARLLSVDRGTVKKYLDRLE